MAHLFEPFTLKGVTLRNRVGVAPMCMYSSEDGRATDWHLVHLGQRAVGGAGLVIAEATAVTPEGRISPQDAGIWSDEHVEPLARICRFVEAHGAVSGIQLAHAGRKASVARPWEGGLQLSPAQGGWETLAPSAIPFREGDAAPREMTREDIAGTVRAFCDATRRAKAAGYRWLELHGAHGYLGHEFLSPLSNRRTDEYGGSLENRIRFPLELTRAVRAVWPEELPLTWRISATDWTEGGWNLEESIELARRLKVEGVDLIDCSTGGNVARVKIPLGPGYQVEFAEGVRRGADIPTAAVGLITEAAQADVIIREGRADLVFLARATLRDPYWPAHAARELGQDAALKAFTPPQYERAY